MKEVIVVGKTLEEIREEWALTWKCSPEKLVIDVLEKPGVFNRNWKVKVILPEELEQEELSENTVFIWDGEKYGIHIGADIEKVVPYPPVGRLTYKGQEVIQQIKAHKGEILEFYPLKKDGGLAWQIEVLPDRYRALAKIKHISTGRYIVDEIIPKCEELIFENIVKWVPEPDNLSKPLTEDNYNSELLEKRIIYGIRPEGWIDLLKQIELLKPEEEREVVLAEATMPIQPVQDQIIDYTGESIKQEENQEQVIDFFASKLQICQKDDILAKIIPGKEGIPGQNVLGEILPVEPFKRLKFKLGKNVYLSEDGMEVRAGCGGLPMRVTENTYQVENVHIVSKDVDLETGSIDFPGDVRIGGNVNDGLRVHAEGSIQVRGSVASAELKAEVGVQVHSNIMASKIIIGERHVNRSRFCKALQELNEDLMPCISQVEQLQSVSKDTKAGHILKVLLEKKYPNLGPKSQELEQMLHPADAEFVIQELEVAIRTVKHFLVGLGPLQLEDLRYFKSALKAINHFLETKGNVLPESVLCETNYIQNSEIICAGDFICRKGTYNSSIKAGGSIKVFGVCRGGEISCGGDIYIWELGGPSLGSTVIKMAKTSRLAVDYCHGNVKIYVGKEMVTIDEYVQKLDIYREKGIVQVDKIKWDGRN